MISYCDSFTIGKGNESAPSLEKVEEIMPQRLIEAIEYQCCRCLYKWISRIEKPKPRCCAKCKSYLWDSPKTRFSHEETRLRGYIQMYIDNDTEKYALICNEFLNSDPRYPTRYELLEVYQVLKIQSKDEKERKEIASELMRKIVIDRYKKGKIKKYDPIF